MLRFFILFLFLLSLNINAFGQVSAAAQQQARTELKKRGIEEDEVRAKLMERGIDTDNIRPEQLPALEKTLEDIIKEIEAEKRQKKSKKSDVKDDFEVETDSSLIDQDELPEERLRRKEVGEEENMDEKTEEGSEEEGDDNTPKRTKQREKEKDNDKGNDKATKRDRLGKMDKSLPDSTTATTQKKTVKKAAIYGQELFRVKSSSVFNVAKDAKPPDTYVLGSGDEVVVSVFGPSQFDKKYIINSEGYITPSEMPKIFLRGVTYGKARELVRSRFSQFYLFRPDQFSMSILAGRNITINIFGELVNYGSYTLPATNTALNAIVAAGGLTDLGSVRNIKLVRGTTSQRIDLYQYIKDPRISADFGLQESDIVHVPVAERVVTVEGAVQRPHKYELLSGENVLQVLDFAGGFATGAYQTAVLVNRFSDNRQVVIDVDLATTGKTFELKNGDIITVRKIKSKADNFVSVGGAVDIPGRYALDNTLTINDLVKRGGLRRDSRTDLAFILRTNSDKTIRLLKVDLDQATANPTNSALNLPLQARDSLVVYTTERFADKYKISVTGAVRRPDTFSYNVGLRLTDVLAYTGGTKPEATDFGYILRSDRTNPEKKTYIRVNLADAAANPNGASNIAIEAGDRLQVLSKTTFTDTAPVRVSGAVRKPGEFIYSPSLTLRDALTLAGGLRIDGSKTRIDIFRVKIENNESTRTFATTLAVDDSLRTASGNYALQPYDQVVVRQVPDFELQKVVNIEGEVTYPGFYALLSPNEPLSSVIERAGGLTPEASAEGTTLYRTEEKTGYIVTQLEVALKQKRGRYDLPLRDGDIISVPKSKDIVTINVVNTQASEFYADRFIRNGKINVAYEPGKNAKWYVNNYAAGLAKGGRWRFVTVEDPNGRISKTKQLGLGLDFPEPRKGSIVNVGTKKKKPEKAKGGKKVDWDKAFTQILTAVTAAATVFALTRRQQ
jgi:protein involved in polysaccharide export with SLBB domain